MAVSKEDLLRLQDSHKLRQELHIALRWRVLTSKGGVARITAYQDARDVQKVLDHVCGPDCWENEPLNINGKLYMSIRIKTEDGWVSRSDVGTESNIEAVKGEASDALKRAAVMWGIFRDIYDIDYIVLKFDGKYPLTNEGVQLQTPEAINLYCNGVSEPMGHLVSIYKALRNRIEERIEIRNLILTLKEFINENR